MRLSFTVAGFLVMSALGASADPIFTTSPLPPITLADGSTFSGVLFDFHYTAAEGDTRVLGMRGFQGIQLVGVPPFLREVQVAGGRDIEGTPIAGTYVIEMLQDGVHVPTLDMTMRFIPR